MLLTEGFMRRLFEVFENHHTSVDVVATSEVSVSVTIDDASRLEALVVDLHARSAMSRWSAIAAHRVDRRQWTERTAVRP